MGLLPADPDYGRRPGSPGRIRADPGLGDNPDFHPDIGSDLVIRAVTCARLDVSDRRSAVATGEEADMVWKVIGIVVVAWIALSILTALVKGLMPLLVIAAIGTGLYLLYKAVQGGERTKIGKP
ncbi:hypothetical protein ACWEVD_18670 [Nocardia thailandica]|uniref:DUF2516 domain-containing protein n=1 Tax=Nocardia thailandica TaxID=257275 RepID=A0ABW6PQ07_9NOCA